MNFYNKSNYSTWEKSTGEELLQYLPRRSAQPLPPRTVWAHVYACVSSDTRSIQCECTLQFYVYRVTRSDVIANKAVYGETSPSFYPLLLSDPAISKTPTTFSSLNALSSHFNATLEKQTFKLTKPKLGFTKLNNPLNTKTRHNLTTPNKA